MVSAGTAKDGMVAKLAACLEAIAGGVKEVRIVDGRGGAFDGAPGTTISTTQEYSQC
jgi:acetylglutamate kinase